MGHSRSTNRQYNKRTSKVKTQDRELSTCIFCDLPVYRSQDIFHLGIDKPKRIDLVTHKNCYKQYRDNGDLKKFLQENLEEYIEKFED